MHKHSVAGLFAGLGAASIWGGMYVVSKVVLEVIPPFALLSIRLVMGALVLGIIIYFRKDKVVFSKEQFWKSFFVGVVGYGVSLGFQFVGTKLSTASNGSLVTSATPAFVLIFAPFLLGEKTTTRRIVALVVSTLGVLAVIDPRNAELSPTLFWGNMSLLAAALTWALYSVLVRKVSQSGDLLTSSTVMLLGGLPSSIAFGLWEVNTQGVGAITPGIIGGLLFLGIVSTAIAMFLWNYAFAELPAAVASLTFFAQPVVGTLLGWFFLAEKITPLFLFGGALISVGILIATRE
ncbi:MAG TPA: DMT family transporter [Anaerolineales bacterium]|nr:DMT family transporter [Anaerolineales bacterium]HMV97333.1 DMT family transporter [Anaerolineales bacterium]HMX19020.1 DMT family transporter [Anaerolineales bacterium]HMX75830.1 DMT family transporter [Anaerolineales bacterium]HMZ41513.1 DMT family transporter [Anaerolineales bacterium]